MSGLHQAPDMDAGKRIRELRDGRKMTQRELGELTGYSEEYVRLIETGHRMGKVAIAKMLQALGEPLDGTPLSRSAEIVRVKPRKRREIEESAESWAIGMFSRAVELAQPMPVTMAFQRLPELVVLPVPLVVGTYASGAEGQTWCESKEGPIHCEVREDVFHRAELGSGPDRWTVAHEIAHVIMHFDELIATPGSMFRDMDVMRPKDRAAINSFKVYESAEWQANAWAGAWLMPIASLRAYLGSQYAMGAEVTSQDLARHFVVSPQAAEIRMASALPALAQAPST